MAGGYYTALSGMQARLAALDRLAADIANAGTAGYKTERAATAQADRPSFGALLQSAVDVADGPARLDLRAGAIAETGRTLDVAIEGSGFFVVDTPAGQRYTRNGHFLRRADGTLTTDGGDPVEGANGPIRIAGDPVHIDSDGTIRTGDTVVGQLKVVQFGGDARLVSEGGARFRSDATPRPVERPSIRSGALEQSNVSMVERVAELTGVTRNFETLSKAVSVLMNDVDGRAIAELGRR
jgi:flagellar basal body rod protein FlgG